MKLRAREVIDELGCTRYIAEYRRYFIWWACNDIGYGLPGPSYRSGYPTKQQCQARLDEFRAENWFK